MYTRVKPTLGAPCIAERLSHLSDNSHFGFSVVFFFFSHVSKKQLRLQKDKKRRENVIRTVAQTDGMFSIPMFEFFRVQLHKMLPPCLHNIQCNIVPRGGNARAQQRIGVTVTGKEREKKRRG